MSLNNIFPIKVSENNKLSSIYSPNEARKEKVGKIRTPRFLIKLTIDQKFNKEVLAATE